MNKFCILRSRFAPVVLCAVAACVVSVTAPSDCHAQGGFGSSAVGGVWIDVDGVLKHLDDSDLDRLIRERQKAMSAVPGDFNKKTKLRKISLRRLNEAILKHRGEGDGKLPDEIRYLAGIQRIQYVFIYPEQNDIVLAGPGEGWKLNRRGEPVGKTTGLPVLRLDDLLVALRSSKAVRGTGVGCSIDPSADGIKMLQRYLKKQKRFTPQVIDGIAQKLGKQNIRVFGVPKSSHFAQVMVAADYRMKRYAMQIEAAPIKGMPSFLKLIAKRSSRPKNMMPRWWMAADYKPMKTDGQGLAWELRPGVKVMTEDAIFGDDNKAKLTGSKNPTAKKWADTMTAKYDKLSAKDSIFADLRNCMDLAVVAALITKEKLDAKAGLKFGMLMDKKNLLAEKFNSPEHVDTQVSFVKKGRNYLITASGGVQFNSWLILEKQEVSDDVAPIRAKAIATGTQWWWN